MSDNNDLVCMQHPETSRPNVIYKLASDLGALKSSIEAACLSWQKLDAVAANLAEAVSPAWREEGPACLYRVLILVRPGDSLETAKKKAVMAISDAWAQRPMSLLSREELLGKVK